MLILDTYKTPLAVCFVASLWVHWMFSLSGLIVKWSADIQPLTQLYLAPNKPTFSLLSQPTKPVHYYSLHSFSLLDTCVVTVAILARRCYNGSSSYSLRLKSKLMYSRAHLLTSDTSLVFSCTTLL